MKKLLSITTSILFIVSCGGGGGGGGTTPTPPTTPAPTVNLSANPISVLLENTSTLTWSSTNATSCSGSWTTQTGNSGSEAVTISTAGNNSFSITCTGAGGSRSASVTVEGYRETDGVVVDGYISGAEVCIDEDESWTCDASENSTTSDNDGKFTIRYSNGNLVSIGGTDLDSQTLLDNLLITHKLTGHSDFKAVTPVTSVAAFMTDASQVNAALGIDSSIDVSIFDPVANKGDGGISDYLYEKGNQLTVLAFALQNITNNLNTTTETTQDYFKAITEEIEKEFTETETKVDIETEAFITKVLDNVIAAKTLTISDDAKANTTKALSGVMPVIEVKSSDDLTTSVIRFAVSTLQTDIQAIANGTASAETVASYTTNVLTYIAEDQNIEADEITPDISAIADLATTSEDTSVTINVVLNDSYLTSAPISVSAGNGSNGTTILAESSPEQIVYTPNADYNGTDTFSYTITQGDKTSSADVTVTIEAVNDAPSIDTASTIQVAENQTAVTTISVSDVDEDGLTLTLSGADADNFDLSTDNVLNFKEAPDFETKSSYSITLSLSDGEETVDKDINIVIINVNDIAPEFTSEATFSAAENQTAIGTVTATDAEDDAITFTVSGSELAITPAGVLTFTSEPDYETKATYKATVTANDGINSTRKDITVNVTNINDNSPELPFDPDSSLYYGFIIDENQTLIGSMAATDADGDELTYSLSNYNGTEDASLILISNTGILSLKTAGDYETQQNSYYVEVTATDGTFSDSQGVSIGLNNINDESPVFTSSEIFSAAENQTEVGSNPSMMPDLEVTDADGIINIVTFSVSGNELAVTQDGILTFISAPDYETKSSYTATVTASDGVNTTTQDITVNVTNVNDIAPEFTSSATFSVAENQTAIGSVVASDAEGDEITFTVSGSELAITSAGVLTFVSAPDYETKTTYTATVTASDGANSITQDIIVDVTNVNEEPVITNLTSTIGSEENQLNVFQVNAVDYEGNQIYYSLSGIDSEFFNINSSGQIKFKETPDYETPLDNGADNLYSINIIVSDTEPSIINNLNIQPSYSISPSTQTSNNSTEVSIINVDEDLINLEFNTTDGTLSEAPSLSINLTIDELTQASEVQVLTWLINNNQTWYTASKADSLNWNINESLDSTAASGTYEIRQVLIKRDGLDDLTIVDTALKEKGFDIDSIIYNAGADSTDPILTSIDSINVSGNDGDLNTNIIVTILASVTDGDGEIDKVFSYIKGPGGEITGSWGTLNSDKTEVTFTFVLDPRTATGTYTIDDIRLFDVAGNQKFYSNSELAAEGFTNSWEISNTLSDNTAPIIAALSLTSSINTSDLNRKQITIDLTTDEQETDINDIYIRLISPDNANIDQYIVGDGRLFTTTKDGNSYSHTISLPLEYPDGTYNISYIFLNDNALNQKSYEVSELNLLGFNTNVVFGSGNAHAPDISSSSTFTVNENQTSIGTITASDADGDTITYSISGSDITINSISGVITFASAPNYESQSSYTATVTVSDGTNSTTQDITVNVTDVTEAVAVDDSSSGIEDDNIRVDVLANDTFNSADVTLTATDGTNMTVEVQNDATSVAEYGHPTIIYSPDANWFGTDTFTYTVSSGGESDQGTVSVTVTSVNDAPTITSEATFSAAENQTDIGTVTATDADGDSVTFTVSGSELAITSAGVLTFVSAPDYETKATYTATLTALDGINLSTQNITVNVTNVPDLFRGEVIDGYISGAEIFIDQNFNFNMDDGEYSATTSSDGSFTIDIGDEDVYKCLENRPIIANVPVGAIDSSLGEVSQAYQMVLPSISDTGNTSIVISPFTSLFAEAILSSKSNIAQDLTVSEGCESDGDNIAANISTRIDELKASIESNFGISYDQLLSDFIENPTDDVDETSAQNIAKLLPYLQIIDNQVSDYLTESFDKNIRANVSLSEDSLSTIFGGSNYEKLPLDFYSNYQTSPNSDGWYRSESLDASGAFISKDGVLSRADCSETDITLCDITELSLNNIANTSTSYRKTSSFSKSTPVDFNELGITNGSLSVSSTISSSWRNNSENWNQPNNRSRECQKTESINFSTGNTDTDQYTTQFYYNNYSQGFEKADCNEVRHYYTPILNASTFLSDGSGSSLGAQYYIFDVLRSGISSNLPYDFVDDSVNINPELVVKDIAVLPRMYKDLDTIRALFRGDDYILFNYDRDSALAAYFEAGTNPSNDMFWDRETESSRIYGQAARTAFFNKLKEDTNLNEDFYGESAPTNTSVIGRIANSYIEITDFNGSDEIILQVTPTYDHQTQTLDYSVESSLDLDNIKDFIRNGINGNPLNAKIWYNPDGSIESTVPIKLYLYEGDDASIDANEGYFEMSFNLNVSSSSSGNTNSYEATQVWTIEENSEIFVSYSEDGVTLSQTVINIDEDKITLVDSNTGDTADSLDSYINQPSNLNLKLLNLISKVSDKISGIQNFFEEGGKYTIELDLGSGGHSLVAFDRNIVKNITGTFTTKSSPTYAISVNDMIINEGDSKDICFSRSSNGDMSATEFELSFTQRERPGKGGLADDFTLYNTTIIFDENATQSCTLFSAIKDTHFDWAHDIYLDISEPSNGQSISRSRMKITILDIYFPNRIDWRRK